MEKRPRDPKISHFLAKREGTFGRIVRPMVTDQVRQWVQAPAAPQSSPPPRPNTRCSRGASPGRQRPYSDFSKVLIGDFIGFYNDLMAYINGI